MSKPTEPELNGIDTDPANDPAELMAAVRADRFECPRAG